MYMNESLITYNNIYNVCVYSTVVHMGTGIVNLYITLP